MTKISNHQNHLHENTQNCNTHKNHNPHSPGPCHGHSHSHHNHYQELKGLSPNRILWAFFLNLIFAIIELIGGLWTNSFAIISDAIHDFGDALALGLGYFLEKKSFQKSQDGYSYGYRRYSILSALLTAIVLITGSSFVLVSSVKSFFEPKQVHSVGMMGLSILGIIINGSGALILFKGHSLNEKVLSWHLIEDLMGWIFVLLGGALIYFTDWYWIDPLLAVLLSIWVIKNVIVHLKSSVQIVLQAAPIDFTNSDLTNAIKIQEPLVKGIHHLHCWSLDGEQHILTCHLVVASNVSLEQTLSIKQNVKTLLKEKFKILEATLEVEHENQDCGDPEHRHF